MIAPTMSFGRPMINGPLTLVSSTTTSSGTRKMRVTVSEFGRFISGVVHDNIGGCDEGDSARGGQGYAAAPVDGAHAKTDRADLRPALPSLSARSAEAGARDRRGDPQPQLPAAPHRGS